MALQRSSRVVVRSLERPSIQITSRAALLPARQATTTQFRQPVSQSTSLKLQRPFSVLRPLREQEAPSPSGIPPPKSYSYEEVNDLVNKQSPNRILIDVREPSELLQTGRIPTAKSIPISSAPDAFFMNEEDFETKFGFARPTEKDEVIFYCKAGVRSRQAAMLAGQARPPFGGKLGNYNGSWLDWEKSGGKAEREGDQGEESSIGGVTNTQSAVPATPRP